jgi:hypothetical protein
MLNARSGWRWLGALGLGLWLGPLTLAANEDAIEAEYEHMRKTHAPALVTIKFVQKTQGSMGNYAGENEINGVMIAPGGLVLCSNTLLGGGRARYRDGRSVPTDIKVLIGDDTEGLPATYVARDTELDLAWLQIKDVGEPPVRERRARRRGSRQHQAAPGPALLTLGVMGRYFGQEVLVSEGQVAGRTHKPRELYVVRGSHGHRPRLPIFTHRAMLVGFACVQQPDADEVSWQRRQPPGTAAAAWSGLSRSRPSPRATAGAREVRDSEEAAAQLEPADEAPEQDEPGEEE